MQKWITAIVAIVGVASGIVAIIAFFRPPTQAEAPAASVRASGDHSIAAGNDVRIGERTVIDQHDFDRDRAQETQRYLTIARGACKSLKDRINSMTIESSFDMTAMPQLYPREMHPPEMVNEQYGEQVRTDITTRLEDNLKLATATVKPLITNSIRTMTGQGPPPDAETRATFAKDKKAWLDNTNDLCRYLNTLGT